VTSRDWLTEFTVRNYNDDELRDWISATRKAHGTETMALIVARGLKAMNFAQQPLPSSTHSRSNYSYSSGKVDAYSGKSRARSMSVEPTPIGISGRNEYKHGASAQQVYEPYGYHGQQVASTKANDIRSYTDGAYGGAAKSLKGHQTSEYPPAYQNTGYSIDPTAKHNAYPYDQARTDYYRQGSGPAVPQAPYAQASFPYYDDSSSGTSDTSPFSGPGSFRG